MSDDDDVDVDGAAARRSDGDAASGIATTPSHGEAASDNAGEAAMDGAGVAISRAGSPMTILSYQGMGWEHSYIV
jgi:hypothetical protein